MTEFNEEKELMIDNIIELEEVVKILTSDYNLMADHAEAQSREIDQLKKEIRKQEAINLGLMEILKSMIVSNSKVEIKYE